MSTEDGSDGVILIAAEANNQDGTQTYYILDPCASESAPCKSNIELIDLTGEITNTGAIAVLSTNSDTGALEITLTKKVKEEAMEFAAESHESELASDEIFTDDDLASCRVKYEEEDVDIEEVSINDNQPNSEDQDMKNVLDDSTNYPELLSNEADASNLETTESSKQMQNEQEDEPEEGTLYIDDVSGSNLSNSQETSARDCVENSNNCGGDVFKVPNVKDVDSSIDELIEQAKVLIKETNSMEDLHMSNDESDVNQEESNNQEAFIHGQLIQLPSQEEREKTTDTEYVDSTNTALTLLELAGGNYRSTVEGMDVEVLGLRHDLISPPSENQQQTGEYTTLTTLEPVVINTPNRDVEVQEDPPNVEAAPNQNTPKTDTPAMMLDKAKLSSDLQRLGLLDGDTPVKAKRMSYRGLSSSLVSQREIVEEVLKRTQSKVPYTQPRDLYFAKKLSYKLATRIVPSEKSELEGMCVTKDQGSLGANSLNISSTPSSRDSLCSQPSDGNTPLAQQSSAISDKYELLKILEDDPDDPDDFVNIEQSKLLNKIINKKSRIPKKPRAKFSPLLKLHPELEKELALKQLDDFNKTKFRGRKPTLVSDILKRTKQEKALLANNQEHNNNTNSKRRGAYSLVKAKKFKQDSVDVNSVVTVDPSQVTETLAVEGQEVVGEQTKDSKSFNIKQYSNKRLSRNSDTPPREIPMEILLNGVEDDRSPKDGEAKNKIFKATNPRKRKEELEKKKQKHFANVLQRVKPHKKRGRPPKKKLPPVDTFNDNLIFRPTKHERPKNGVDKDDVESVLSKENDLPRDEKLQKGKKLTEIEKLLGDEGAINMLYSVEQKRSVGSEPKRGVLPSYRRKKKDLILKTKLVKSAVLRLTASPGLVSGRISLRGQVTKEGEPEETPAEIALRKMSVDSHDSHHSLNSSEVFPHPAKIVPAEASRIIRRHSSSSNYSSRSNSPRRLSVDGGVLSPESKEMGQGDAALHLPSASRQQKPVKTPHQTPAVTNEKGLTQEKQVKVPSSESKTPLSTINKVKPKEQLKSRVSSGRPRGRPRKNQMSEDDMTQTSSLISSLAAAVDDFSKENENVDDNIPTPKKPTVTTATRTGSKVAVYRKSAVESPVRAKHRPKQSVVYKEITLKRHDHLVEIILSPVSTTLKNALNANVLREIVSVLMGLTKDENCRVVLITSAGSVFCQGVDFCELVQDTPEKRMAVALEMAVAIKDFIKALATFTKPVVAGVQGPAVGLGVTMLPLCDLVYTSDKATFHTPYARLGQVPEGAATLTLPTQLGYNLTSELLFTSRKLTASEAHCHGLVTRILSSDNFHDELIPVVKAMASQSSQAMDATKAMLRHNLLTGLETTLVSETHLLIQHWTSPECQANFNLYLTQEEHSLALQKELPEVEK